jgi:hypothetical protein
MIDLDALIEDLRSSARMAEEDCIALGEDDVESAAYHHGVGAGLMKAVAEIERRRS